MCTNTNLGNCQVFLKVTMYFKERSVVHYHNTRNIGYFHVHRARTELGKKSLKIIGSSVWNKDNWTKCMEYTSKTTTEHTELYRIQEID